MARPVKIVVLIAVVAAVAPGGAAARPGDLDPTFGPNGGQPILTDFRSQEDRARNVWELPDGRILVSGCSAVSMEPFRRDVALARFRADGARDETFSGNGKRTLRVNGDGCIMPVAPARGRKIVIADLPPDGVGIRLRRLAADGSLDRTFGDGGTLIDRPFIAPAPQVPGVLDALAVQADGKVVAAAYSGVVVTAWTGPAAFAGLLLRYTADGRPDPTFGVEGRAILPPILFPGGGADVKKILMQPDGAILVAGDLLRPDLDFDLWVARFLPDGTLDLGFGTGGVAVADFGGWDWLEDVVYAGNGSIYLLASTFGRFLVPGSPLGDVGIARLTPAGALDGSFGQAGRLPLQLNGYPTSLAVWGNGRFAVSAYQLCGAQCEVTWISAHRADGSSDTRFGSGGQAFLPMRIASALRPTSRGLLVTGHVAAGTRKLDIALARLLL